MPDAERITVALDAEIVAKTREALGGGDEPDAAVIERALNAYLLKRLVSAVNARSVLSEDDADRIAADEVRAHRSARRGVA